MTWCDERSMRGRGWGQLVTSCWISCASGKMIERVNGAVCLCHLCWIIWAASCQLHCKILNTFVSVYVYVLHRYQKSNTSVDIKDSLDLRCITLCIFLSYRISEVVRLRAVHTHIKVRLKTMMFFATSPLWPCVWPLNGSLNANKGHLGSDMSIRGGGGGFILSSWSSNILFILNTKSSGRLGLLFFILLTYNILFSMSHSLFALSGSYPSVHVQSFHASSSPSLSQCGFHIKSF